MLRKLPVSAFCVGTGSHFVSDGVLQLDQSVALIFGVLHRVCWSAPWGSVFVRQAQGHKSTDSTVF